MTRTRIFLALLAAGCLAPQIALATDGYFSHGYGIKSKGMAGASMTRTDDTFGGANNPAQMVFVGNRLDAGLDWFSPERDAERSGAAIPPLNGKVESGHTNFFIPEFGYNRMISSDMSLGVTVYGNGGMNSSYPQGAYQCPNAQFQFGPANALCGSGKLGVDLSQLLIAPTLSWKFTDGHSVGVSPLFGYQRFKIEGVQLFTQLSGSPGDVSNNGYSSSTGYGIRIGYLGHISNAFRIGASYATKMKMGEFDKYKGLFAEQGGFDMPASYTVGIGLQPMPELSVLLDYKRIQYSGVNSIGNRSSNQAPLGSNGGPGFGWQDISVVKLGVEYALDKSLTLRAGFGRSDNPIEPRDVTFNILAPGVVQDHYTLGFTYSVGKNTEWSVAYMHAPRVTVTGSSLFNALFPIPNAGGNETIGMSQNSLGFAFGTRF
ncbi:MAG: porin [Betaproteobacteria bacterium]|nr:porin [Betaproteobacteria bacterium]